MKPGDRVNVDLSGMYIGYCHYCNSVGLFVPGGACANCQRSERDAGWLRDVTPEDADFPEAQ